MSQGELTHLAGLWKQIPFQRVCEEGVRKLQIFQHLDNFFLEDYKHRAKHTIYLSSIKFLISSIT